MTQRTGAPKTQERYITRGFDPWILYCTINVIVMIIIILCARAELKRTELVIGTELMTFIERIETENRWGGKWGVELILWKETQKGWETDIMKQRWESELQSFRERQAFTERLMYCERHYYTIDCIKTEVIMNWKLKFRDIVIEEVKTRQRN